MLVRYRSATKTVIICSLLAMLSACATLDDRSAVYSQFGGDAVLMRPTFSAPAEGSLSYRQNNFVFLPGVLVRPDFIIAETDHARRRSAIWSSTRVSSCVPSPELYTLADVEERGLPEINVHYDFRFSASAFIDALSRFDFGRLFRLAQPGGRLDAAASEFEISENDLRYLKSINIRLSNVRQLQANDSQLRNAYRNIVEECPHLSGEWQIRRAFSADIEVNIESLQGATINVPALSAAIRRRLSVRVNGYDQFFAIDVMRRPSV